MDSLKQFAWLSGQEVGQVYGGPVRVTISENVRDNSQMKWTVRTH